MISPTKLGTLRSANKMDPNKYLTSKSWLQALKGFMRLNLSQVVNGLLGWPWVNLGRPLFDVLKPTHQSCFNRAHAWVSSPDHAVRGQQRASRNGHWHGKAGTFLWIHVASPDTASRLHPRLHVVLRHDPRERFGEGRLRNLAHGHPGDELLNV